ncbi:MAG TPA: hypothetical protein VMT46_14265 [Anaerolineaceae bacterium]|nr:hypothetical protein [Anaerolineaceae bacterium]
MERFITEQIETQVRDVFQKLAHPVKILYFTTWVRMPDWLPDTRSTWLPG